jgi:hypothetical protein
MAVFGGAAWDTGAAFQKFDGTNLTTTGPYFFDPSKSNANQVGGASGTGVNSSTGGGLATDPGSVGGNMWQNQDNMPSQITITTTGTTGYASVGGKDVIYYASGFDGNTANNGLWTYTVNSATDPSQNVWTQVGSVLGTDGGTFSNQGAGAFDAKDNVYVRTAQVSGQYGILFWNLNNPGAGNTWDFKLFPPTELASNGYFMGMDWDPTLDMFFLWDGNGNVFELDPTTWTLTSLFPSGGPPSENPLGTFNGVLGDWHYICFDLMADGTCSTAPGSGVFAGVTQDQVDGVFSPQVWLFNPDTASVTDPPVPEPGSLSVLLFGAGFALARRRRG